MVSAEIVLFSVTNSFIGISRRHFSEDVLNKRHNSVRNIPLEYFERNSKLQRNKSVFTRVVPLMRRQ
jgi:hypothetical protein